jgi:hypothetical protein
VFRFSDLPETLTSPVPAYMGNFGSAVGISDGLVIVGAKQAGAGFDGAAYLYNTISGTVTALVDPHSDYDGYFGASVAISGAIAAVGAPGEPAGGTGPSASGNVYLYDTANGALIRIIPAPAPTGFQFDFGASVSLNGPGTQLAVGAPGQTYGKDAESGYAYVFNTTTGALISSLVSGHPSPDGEFGTSVSIAGTTLVVGAPYENITPNPATADSGNAYVFFWKSGTWSPAPYVSLPNPDGYEAEFGTSVATSGPNIVVGAPYANLTTTLVRAGRVFVYSAATGVLTESLYSSTPVSDGAFGTSVAISGGTVAVGAPGEMGFDLSHAGYVHVYTFAAGMATDLYFSPNAQNFGEFGESVAVGPGGLFAAGAPGENSLAGPTGFAYLL